MPHLTDRRRDPQHAISQDAWERLHDARDARGRRLEVTRLPMPGPLRLTAREAAGIVTGEGTKVRRAGERLAGSYVNFYIANGGIVMPLLDARTDRIAAQRLKRLFPGRRMLGVPARETARRRQHPLHYATNSARNANPITVCEVIAAPGCGHTVSSRLCARVL
jgi:agmatine/peptidylarginine deiminase